MAAGTANLTGKSLQICDDLERGRSMQKAAVKFGVRANAIDEKPTWEWPI